MKTTPVNKASATDNVTAEFDPPPVLSWATMLAEIAAVDDDAATTKTVERPKIA